jgi:hypothetical protein
MAWYQQPLDELRNLGASVKVSGGCLAVKLPKSMSVADLVRCGLLVERAAMFGYAGVRIIEDDESIKIDAESD